MDPKLLRAARQKEAIDAVQKLSLPAEKILQMIRDILEEENSLQPQDNLPREGPTNVNVSISNKSKNSDWGANDSGHKDEGKMKLSDSRFKPKHRGLHYEQEESRAEDRSRGEEDHDSLSKFKQGHKKEKDRYDSNIRKEESFSNKEDSFKKPGFQKSGNMEEYHHDELSGYSNKRQDQTVSDLSGARFERSDTKPKNSQNWYQPNQTKYQESRNDWETKKSKIISSKLEEGEEEDKGKYVEHELNWDDDNDKGWGESNSRKWPSKTDNYQPQQRGYRGQRGNRGGYPNKRGGNNHYDSNYRADYRRSDHYNYPKNPRGGREYEKDDRYQRKGGGTILDNQAPKSNYISIADYISRKMVDDHEWQHRKQRDPGPESLKKDSS